MSTETPRPNPLGRCLGAALAMLFVAVGCSTNGELGDVDELDAGDQVTGDGSAGSLCGTCGSGARSCPDFWAQLAINANWGAFFPTIQDLAQGSEAVLYGSIASIEEGPTVQGDTPGDVYTELQLLLAPDSEVWRGEVEPARFRMTITPGFADTTVSSLSECLPESPVLVLARKRRDQDAYVPVNGYGLWASTPRATVDAPLNPEHPTEGLYADEIAKYGTLREFADALRRYAAGN